MTDETGERLGAVENRLGAVEKELTSLGRDVAKLRILEEENARTIKLIAEGHGAKFDSLGRRLDDVFTAVKPLQQMKDFFERVADDHELRITALEKREG